MRVCICLRQIIENSIRRRIFSARLLHNANYVVTANASKRDRKTENGKASQWKREMLLTKDLVQTEMPF